MARRGTHQPSFQWNEQLILFRYFLHQFDHKTLFSFAGKMNKSEYEGLDTDQNTYFYHELVGMIERRGVSAKINKDTLRIYDENISRYVKQIGEGRGGLKLKYFQYIACLFTEMYLDNYFSNRADFEDRLNRYNFNNVLQESFGEIQISKYSSLNMNKLAFMCATGSGKTLIMHINILQFQHYLNKALRTDPRKNINKIILLSPNEGMTNQHLKELELSHISAEAFNKSGFGSTSDVVVIDMNKLKEEGKVKTVSVDSFEQNNLVLIDEAHRGLAGDVWYEFRSRLSAEGGFAFEYSATLKQALKTLHSQKDKAILDEYFRSIIIDYSYKYFYEDGYGKEYNIYNLRESIDDEPRQLYLVGCLLSFYQQLKLFFESGREFSSFQIEKPLLVFVGNRVTAKTSVAEMTDVEEVLDFIDKFVNKKEQTIKRLNVILDEKTGLLDSRGRDLFSQSFSALWSIYGGKPNAEEIYNDMLQILFNTNVSTDEAYLHVINLKQVTGEIALKIGMNGKVFGVISIGDTTGLLKNCEARGIKIGNDEFVSESLFRNINEKDSMVNILVGSRKFSEGWNSWRVSTMGLINFAKGEGSQAIQLFGRGVRLKGYGGCLKRSHRLDDETVIVPKNISTLETLTIFGIKAQYMEDFKKYLEMEDMPTGELQFEYTLPVISRYSVIKDKKLRVIKVKKGANFKKQAARLLLKTPDEGFARYLNRSKIILDCRAKVQTIESTFSMQIDDNVGEHVLDEKYIQFLDFERIFNELENFKNEKYYFNISLCKDNLHKILQSKGWYLLIIPKSQLLVDSIEKLALYTDFAIMVLKNYIEKFYKYEKDRWEAPLLEYQELESSDGNFIEEYKFSYYTDYERDTIPDTIETFVNDIRTILSQQNGIPTYQKETLRGSLVAFDFRCHLYTPLISLNAGNLKLTISPVSMNEHEKLFVDKLDFFVKEHAVMFEDKSLYLLRNKSKVGMGFFEAGNFYPDYVLWIDTEDIQFISFIDPKGLRHHQWNDPKIEFY